MYSLIHGAVRCAAVLLPVATGPHAALFCAPSLCVNIEVSLNQAVKETCNILVQAFSFYLNFMTNTTTLIARYLELKFGEVYTSSYWKEYGRTRSHERSSCLVFPCVLVLLCTSFQYEYPISSRNECTQPPALNLRSPTNCCAVALPLHSICSIREPFSVATHNSFVPIKLPHVAGLSRV